MIHSRVASEISSAYTWSPSSSSTSGRVPEGSAATRAERVSRASGPTLPLPPEGGAAQRQEPKATRMPSSSPGVAITEGGKRESGGGHTPVPSSSTSYSVAVPGVRPPTGTRA